MGVACIVITAIAFIVSGCIALSVLYVRVDGHWVMQVPELTKTSYNSAVFASTPSNSYFTFSVSQSFISNSECFGCEQLDPPFEYGAIDFNGIIQGLHQSARSGDLDRLENGDCIDQYSKMIQSSRRNLLLVASDDKFPAADEAIFPNGTNIYSKGWNAAGHAKTELGKIYNWMCSGMDIDGYCYKNIGRLRDNPSSWVVNGYPVDYCLSERATPRCKLQFNTSIAILVTTLNILKAILMFCTVLLTKGHPLMTVGDAVASFLIHNDPTTRNMCLLTQSDARESFLRTGNGIDEVSGRFPVGAKRWLGTTYRWKDATSIRRRVIAFTM
jgi:hypothetical protein